MATSARKSPLSMTGAGTCVVNVPAGRFEAEARSVNHRFLKLSVHLSPALASLEPGIEERARARVERGHVTLALRHHRTSKGAASAFQLDLDLAKAAAKRLAALAKACGLEEGVTLRDVLQVPGVVIDGSEDSTAPAFEKAAWKALDGALEALVASRAKEGRHLAAECGEILDRVAAAVDGLKVKAPQLPVAYRDRLAARIATLLEGSGTTPDPAVLAREVAAFADRSDVSEELARLLGHVQHARDLLAAGGAVGRKLDFLVQEFHREANTLGSKSPDPTVTATVIDLKADVERLREQVQNFE